MKKTEEALMREARIEELQCCIRRFRCNSHLLTENREEISNAREDWVLIAGGLYVSDLREAFVPSDYTPVHNNNNNNNNKSDTPFLP
jgi:hypothetical protein